MIKKLISKLYHKYVCKPDFDPHLTEEEYLKICKEEYTLRKYFDVDTFEKIDIVNQLAKVNLKINRYNKS